MPQTPNPSTLSRIDRILRIREPLSVPAKIALGVVPIAVLFMLWSLLTHGKVEERVISSTILPSPGEVVRTFPGLWFDAELMRSVVASGLRVVGGFVVALIIAFPLGLLMGAFSKVKALFQPMVLFGAYLPIPALVPLTISIFGIEERQKIMFLALAFLVFLLPMFVKAIDEVDETYLQTAWTLGATQWQMVRHVLLGIAAPRIFQAMRLGFGIGWTYIILAEMIDAPSGLGHIMNVAFRRGPREYIYLTLVVIVIIAYITDKLWVWIGRRLFPYQEFS
jgi:NitT/TauT family transport system permease protein